MIYEVFNKYSFHHSLSADASVKFLALILFEIRHLQNFFPCFSKGRNFTRGDNSEKIRFCYFSMRNPYILKRPEVFEKVAKIVVGVHI